MRESATAVLVRLVAKGHAPKYLRTENRIKMPQRLGPYTGVKRSCRAVEGSSSTSHPRTKTRSKTGISNAEKDEITEQRQQTRKNHLATSSKPSASSGVTRAGTRGCEGPTCASTFSMVLAA